MPWYIHVLLFLGPLVLIGGIFGFLHLLTLLTGISGYAANWQLRCTRCDHCRDAGEAGMFRIGAVSAGKCLFGYCTHCQGFRWIAVEHKMADC